MPSVTATKGGTVHFGVLVGRNKERSLAIPAGTPYFARFLPLWCSHRTNYALYIVAFTTPLKRFYALFLYRPFLHTHTKSGHFGASFCKRFGGGTSRTTLALQMSFRCRRRSKSFHLNISSIFRVYFSMLCPIVKFKIFNSIILFVVVFMMYNFITR